MYLDTGPSDTLPFSERPPSFIRTTLLHLEYKCFFCGSRISVVLRTLLTTTSYIFSLLFCFNIHTSRTRIPWLTLIHCIPPWRLIPLSFLSLFCVCFCLVCPMLPVSVDCSFLIALSVFSNVDFQGHISWLTLTHHYTTMTPDILSFLTYIHRYKVIVDTLSYDATAINI